MASSNIPRNSLSQRSCNFIVNIVNDMRNNPDFHSCEFYADQIMYHDSGGLAIHMVRNGNDYQIFGFFPDESGDIERITLLGQNLRREYDAICKSHMAFGLPIDNVSFDEMENRVEMHVNQTLFEILFSLGGYNEISSNKQFVEYLLEGNNQPADGKLIFDSSDHIRFQNGVDVSGHNYGCHRRLVIEKNIQESEGYTVTMYNLDGIHPIWQNNVQMAPKQMKIVNVDGNTVEMRGYGRDPLGMPFSTHGVTLCIEEGHIAQATINMFDRSVSILYLE